MDSERSTGSSASAKVDILRRIRAAIGRVSSAELAQEEWGGLVRKYQRGATREFEAVMELLADRLRDYDAQIVRVEEPAVADTVGRMLRERGKKRMVVPQGLAAKWLPDGYEFVVDDGMTATELDGFDGVITGATLAIAETGTVVLQSVPGQGRRAITLVPDYHLCIVRERNVVETVPDAMARLQQTARLATTFFSGPSATADIEMTRIKGVHGPRYLDVILAG